MRIRLKHVLVALLALVLMAMAYSPLMRAGLLAADYGALLDPEQAHAKPLEVLSLQASRSLWGLPGSEAGDRVALALRLEHLLYLLLSGIGLGYFVRRLLLPWSGSEPAKAAGRAAALLFVLHPLVIWSVADVAARGQLLGLSLAIWSASSFLRGRQDQRFLWLGMSFLLAIAAGFSSWLALGLPALLACCDLTSTHRYRPLRTRLRTSATTLVLFGLAVCLESGLALFLRGDSGMGPLLETARGVFSAAGLQAAIGSCALKLGLLVLPSNPQVMGAIGIVIAGAAFLVAVQPALLAARSAPRLWGWLLCGLAFALLSSLAMSVDVTVNATALGGAKYMLPSIAVMAAGLGLGSTALSGPHRPYMAWVVVIAYAALAHANARPWIMASVELSALRRELVLPLEAHGSLRTVVLDVPFAQQGLEPVGDNIEVLLDPRMAPQAEQAGGSYRRPQGLALAAEDFLSLLFEPEFRGWLGDECLIIYPRSRMGAREDQPQAGPREFTLLRPLEPTKGTRTWLQTLRSPALDLSPIEHAALRVRVGERLELGTNLPVSWRSQASVQPSQGKHSGLWKPEATGSTGWFDLGSSLAWRLGGRVRSIFFEEGLPSIEEASLHTELLGLGDALRVTREARTLRFDGVLLPSGYGLGRLQLSLLDLERFRVRRSSLQSDAPGSYFSANVGPELERMLQAGQPVAWVLEYSIDGQTLARARGRF